MHVIIIQVRHTLHTLARVHILSVCVITIILYVCVRGTYLCVCARVRMNYHFSQGPSRDGLCACACDGSSTRGAQNVQCHQSHIIIMIIVIVVIILYYAC